MSNTQQSLPPTATGDAPPPPTREGEGTPDECSERRGVLHALRADCGVPAAELLALESDAADPDDVRLAATMGKWLASRTGGGSPALELTLLLVSGLALKPASVGSGRMRGETCTL